jgi:hypothetical protein
VAYDQGWRVPDLSLRDILLYHLLSSEYSTLTTDGHLLGGDDLNGPVDIRNNCGEAIKVAYSALPLAQTYNADEPQPSCLASRLAPGATAQNGAGSRDQRPSAAPSPFPRRRWASCGHQCTLANPCKPCYNNVWAPLGRMSRVKFHAGTSAS